MKTLNSTLNSIDILLREYTNTEDILDNFDEIVNFLHDDVERICQADGKTLSWVAYSHSIDTTRRQLTHKQHLRGIQEFHSLEVKEALRWLVSRLKNNSVNFYKEKPHAEDMYYEESHIYDLGDIEKIRKIDPDRFELAFATLARTALMSSDFDWHDFLYLCEKYEMDPKKYELSPVTTIGVESESGYVQLKFDLAENGETTIPCAPDILKKIRKRKAKTRGLFDAA